MDRFLKVKTPEPSKAVGDEKAPPKFGLYRPIGGARGSGWGKAGIPTKVPLWPKIRLRLYFNASSSTDKSTGLVTLDDMLGAIGVVGRVANTSVTCLATSFRVRKVTIYQGPAGASAAYSAINWFSAADEREPDYEEIQVTPLNYQGPSAMLTSYPPKSSTCGYWHRDTSTGTLLLFTVEVGTTGSVVAVDVTFTLPTTIASSNALTVTTAAVGTFYRMSLNRTHGSSSLQPMGYQSTT